MSNQIQAKKQKKKAPVSKAMQSGAPPPRKKQQVRKTAQPQRKNRYDKPQLKVEAPVVPNPGLRQNISVACRFDPMSIDLAYAAIYSWYCTKGFMYFSPHEDQDPVAFVSGLNYLFVSVCNAIKSGELSATKAPAFAIDMFSALRGKTLRFLSYGELSYSWSAPPSWEAMPDIPIQTADWKATIVSFDNEQYNSPAQVVTYSATQDNYSYFLTKAGGVTGNEQSSIVEVAKYKSKLSSDVSAFARNYAYNGLAPSKSGAYYKDVENEVTITAPLWSAFAVYDFDGIESRVPTKLHAYGGDAALAAGWPLHPAFISHFNKRAPAFKCIDFDWICGFLTQWVCLALPKAQSLGEGNVPLGYQIPCSYQDFRIMLRQALLNVFDAQYAVQFTGPLNFGTNNNGFVPFQVNGHCYGGQPFSTMRVPILLRENLNALRPRTLKTARKGGSKINFTTYIPILGRYVTDVPVEPQYKGADGTVLPLFTTAIQDPINLVDGTTAPSSYINLNGSHYQTVLSVWDSVVEKIAPVTASTTSIVGDAGAMGLGALYYTAVVEPGNAGPSLQGKEYLKSPYLANVRNIPSKVASQKDVRNPKGDIKALPPATLVSETMTQTTASIPPSAEMQAMLDSLIVPVIRLDPNDASDQISLQMYQIETKEVISSRYLANPNYGGGGVWTRLSKLAGMCVTGVGKETTAEYDELFRLLSRHNDAGMLSGLLGGLAKTLLPPDAHGIVDVVADVLPF